ncbi:Hypothetical predicted protein [Paramuricea clavata]|uniref:Uncharacterized protein n=1 Tax=Paramuricea clavata TaxID=317549 RepID=A0A7D9HMN6_PARCT|nr:Hypothetical predicted protein [Paramuricea clavata]
MANAQKQNNLAMIQAELNEALERYEKEKRFFRELLKVKLFHDKDALRFLIESTRKELREKELNEERQKQSELEQQNHGPFYEPKYSVCFRTYSRDLLVPFEICSDENAKIFLNKPFTDDR